MQDNRVWAEPFRNMVEGRPFPMSIKIEDDQVFLCANRPVEKGAKPRPELITELLTSNILLSDDVRRLIADWLDPKGESTFSFKKFKRRKPGRHPAWNASKMEIGQFVEVRIERGEKFEAAITDACGEFGKGRTTVTEAYSRLKAARQIESSSRLSARSR